MACLSLGILVLLGWAFGLEALKTVIPGGVTMKPNTALCLALIGASLTLGLDTRAATWRAPLATAFAYLVIAIASMTILEWVSGAHLGIDGILLPHRGAGPSPFPARMALAAAFGFLLLGGSLALFLANRPALAQVVALPAGFTSTLEVFAHAFGSRPPNDFTGFSSVAIHTSVGQSVLFLSILLAGGENGFMRRLSSSGPGGVAARRLLAPAVVLFPLLGLLVLTGQKGGLYGLEFGTGMLTLGHLILFCALVLWAGGFVDTQEAERLAGREKVERQSRQLEQSNAELEQFAYVASHDLQEPLRMIASYLELIERRYKGRLDQDADEFIGFAVDGAKRLQTMIHDLLDYSRVSTRAAPLESVSFEAILEEAISDLGVSIRESETQITHGPMPTVLVDRAQMGQLFRNLIGNALKFKSAATPQVHISAMREPSEWRFSVRDNGIGMEPDHFERVFRMFQRLHTREEYPGTGIGLAVCKRIVERHGGRIWVESVPHEGSKFSFTLPATGGNGP